MHNNALQERPADRSATRTLPRAALPVLFAVYLAFLAWTVLWKLQTPYVGAAAGVWRPFKLVPFVAFGEFGASDPTELLVNVALFVPFGVYLAVLAPKRPWWWSVVVCGAFSLALELLQHLLSVGSFDVTDVITNTAGGLIGWAAMQAAHRRSNYGVTPRTAFLLCLALTVLWVVALVIVMVFGPNLVPQHDIVVR